MTAGGDGPLARAELEELSDRIGEAARRDPTAIAARLAGIALRDQVEVALRLPAHERLEVLLHSPKPMRLVRSLPAIETYLTVREVGPVAALPLVSLLSGSQIQHVVDLESWRSDRLDSARAGAWVAVFLESGDATLHRFLRNADDEMLVLLARDWMRVRPVESEEGQGPETGGASGSSDDRGVVSPDGYYRFEPERPEHVAAARRFAEILFEQDSRRYFDVMARALWDLPSELEEEALRWRQSRLEEHGFPPWDEALEVYGPPRGRAATAAAEASAEGVPEPAPRARLPVLAAFDAFAPAVASLSEAALDRLLRGMMAVANRLLVADLADPGDPVSHRRALEKAASFVSIGLSARTGADREEAVRLIETVRPIELFREGWARAVALQDRARRMVDSGWASERVVALELLDTPLRPRVRGLLLPRPAFHDPTTPQDDGSPYRDFRSAAEIEETRVALEMAEVLGTVFVERLGVDPMALVKEAGNDQAEPPRFSTLLLTTLAWHAVRGSLGGDPLPAGVLAEFLRRFVSRTTAPPGAIAGAAKALVDALVAMASLGEAEERSLRAFASACVKRLDEECGDLDPDASVDPRFVSCLRVER